MCRLGEDWNESCSAPVLKQTNELILSPMNVHNIPPLLSNAVIKKPDEPIADTSFVASGSSDTTTASDECQSQESLHSQSQLQSQSQSQDSIDSSGEPNESSSTEQFPSMANFLPDNSFFYNDKNCYIFPGAEIWWNKDSDLESTSSDGSSINDDDDDDDIEDMEISTIERSEMIGDVETTIAVENLLENTNEHEFNKYLLKRNASTSLENIHIEESHMDDFSPKRLKIHQQQPAESSIIDQHVDHTSTMCETLDSSSSSSNSNSNSNTSTSDPTPLPMITTTATTVTATATQNEVFSPKL